MKLAWIGVAVGLGVGAAVVYMTQRGTTPERTAHKPTVAEGSAAIAVCDPGGPSLATAYDKIAEPLHTNLTSDPAKALVAARGQVANLLEGRLQACAQALQITRSLGSADDPRIIPAIAHIRTSLARLSDVINALQSNGSDAPQKLDALDKSIHVQ
jgi:hypothetical protein